MKKEIEKAIEITRKQNREQILKETPMAEILRTFRIVNNLSINDLSEKCNLSQTYITEMENGVKKITLKALEKLSNSLNIKVSILFQLEEEEVEKPSNCHELFIKIVKICFPDEMIIKTVFNVHESVSVRLTKKGLKILKEEHAEIYKYCPVEHIPKFEEPIKDEEGYCKFTIMDLMRVFGSNMKLGKDCPFENCEIIFNR